MKLKIFRPSLFIWIGIFVVWELLVRGQVLNEVFFASPLDIIREVASRDFLSLFALDSIASISNIIIASLLGYILVYCVIFVGLLNKYLYQLLLQLNVIFKYFPIPALIPFGILFFGISDQAKMFIIVFAVFIVYFSHVINIIQKEETSYYSLQKSWKVSPINRFVHFVFPISNYLNYRILANLIIWVISTSIIVEMILGGEFGFGSRLLQFQQLYQIDRLFAYLVGIILFGLLFEKILTWFFARLYFDGKKNIATTLIVASIVLSVLYQFRNLDFSEGRSIITYKAGLNLPVYVMIEEFNSLDLELQTVSSGVQAMDALQSGKTSVGGYVDMPNALSGISQNGDLRISSQVVETQDKPTLFFISREDVTPSNFGPINGGSVGYFPNNPLIASGFEFTAFTKQANPNTLDIVGSNDPATLVQSFVSDTIDSVIAPEPYISQIENQTGIERVNPDFSLIQGVNFDSLPLAALVMNVSELTIEEAQQLSEDMEDSIDYIRKNTEVSQASGDLIDILTKYGLDEDMVISAFQKNSEVQFEDTERMIDLIKLIDSQSNFEGSKDLVQDDFYN